MKTALLADRIRVEFRGHLRIQLARLELNVELAAFLTPAKRLTIALVFGLASTCGTSAYARCIAVPANLDDRLAAAIRPIGCESQELTLEQFLERFGKSGACRRVDDKTFECSNRIAVNGPSAITLLGGQTRLFFTDPRPGKGGVSILQGKNLVVRDLEVGWVDPFGENQGSSLAARIFSRASIEACPGTAAGGIFVLEKPVSGEAPVQTFSVWDDSSGWPWAPTRQGKQVEGFFPKGSPVSFSNGRSPCIEALRDFVGTRVLLRHYIVSNHAFLCMECEKVAFENVTLRSAPGMGFVFWGGGSGFVLRKNVIAPTCAPACRRAQPTLTSDASHFSAVRGGIVIEDNDFSGQGDDSVNINGLLVPAEVEAPRKDGSAWITLKKMTSDDRAWLLKPGAEVMVFDFGLRDLGRATVGEVDTAASRVKLSKPVSEATQIVLTPADRVPTGALIRNNHFHDHRARGILVSISDAVVEGNTIERVTMAGIMVHADTDFWFEGPGPHDVRIAGNKIRQVNAVPYQPEYPSAISVAFRASPKYRGPVGLPIRRIVIEQNSISDVFRNPSQPVFVGPGTAEITLR